MRVVRADRMGNRPNRENSHLLLVLHIIRQAQLDYVAGPHSGEPYAYDSAVLFFGSEWYQTLLDVIAAYIPDFEPAFMLPEGVEKPEAGQKQPQGRFSGNGHTQTGMQRPKTAQRAEIRG
jgi:hypothetical protein